MAVLPSLIASREYSTWKRRPSGEKVLRGVVVRWVRYDGGVGGWGIGVLVRGGRSLLDPSICEDLLVWNCGFGRMKVHLGGYSPYSERAINMIAC